MTDKMTIMMMLKYLSSTQDFQKDDQHLFNFTIMIRICQLSQLTAEQLGIEVSYIPSSMNTADGGFA